jgi:thioredoxin reductase
MHTDLLIVGAGPFGLAMAAEASHRNIDHIVVGKTVDFWRDNMPANMLLRSGCDWHLDPQNVHTIDRYLETRNLRPDDVLPLSLAFYLDYVEWFVDQKRIEPVATFVSRLDRHNGRFVATLDNRRTIEAQRVLLAPGFKPFRYIPPGLSKLLPAGSYSHTCDCVDFAPLRDKRCVIVGGRQSAFEWAALLREAGTRHVRMIYRHDTPRFETSDWSWVMDMVDHMPADPGWFARLSHEEKAALDQRFWSEGRLKLEPWLKPRIDYDNITLDPFTAIIGAKDRTIELNNSEVVPFDHLIFATGYRVNMANLPYLAEGNLFADMELDDGYPVLDHGMQTTVPGLYVTSMPATKSFGSFFAFTVSVRASAHIVADAVSR